MEEVHEVLRIDVEVKPGVGRATRTKSSVTGSTLSFHQLSYFVDVTATDRRACNCCSTVQKQILHSVR